MTLSPEKQKLIQNAEFGLPYITELELGDWERAHRPRQAAKEILLDAARNDPELALAAAHAAIEGMLKQSVKPDSNFLKDVFPLIEDKKPDPLPEVKGLARLAAFFGNSAVTPAQQLTPVQKLMLRIGKYSIPSSGVNSDTTIAAGNTVLKSIVGRSDFPAEKIMAAVVDASMSKIGNDGYTTIMKVAQTVLPTLPSESIQAEKLAQNIMKLAFSRKPSSASIYHPEVYDAVEARKSLAACAKNNQAVLAQVVEKIKAATEPYEKTSLISGYNQAVFAAADVLANLADIGVRINSQTRQDLTCRVAGVLTDKATTDASFNSASWGTLTTRLAIGKNLYRLAQTDSVLSQALPAGDSINCQSLSKLRMLAETGYSAPLKAPENKPQLR